MVFLIQKVINISILKKILKIEKLKSNTILLNSVLPHILNEWVCLNKKLVEMNLAVPFMV